MVDSAEPSESVKRLLADRMRVVVEPPTSIAQKAAFEHLLHKAQAEFEASELAEVMQADGDVARRPTDRADRLLRLTKCCARRASFLGMSSYFKPDGLRIGCMRIAYRPGSMPTMFGKSKRVLERSRPKPGFKKMNIGPSMKDPDEWQNLQQEWSAAVDRHFEPVMRELCLDELADFRQRDRAAFDAAYEQGRQALHHKEDHRNAIAKLVGRYEAEAKQAEGSGAPYAAIVMYGAACEALLLLLVLDHPHETKEAVANFSQNTKPRGDPMKWTLDALINVTNAAGWLEATTDPNAQLPLFEWAKMLKFSRNLIHPGRHALEHPHASIGEVQVHDAKAMYVMISSALVTKLAEEPL